MVSSKRKVPLLRLIFAFLIATFVFLSGFLIGYSVSYFKYYKISKIQEEIRFDLLSLNLEKEFIGSCEDFVFYSISSELDKMGSIMGILEERFGKRNKKVLEQKKKYTLLEVQHFLNIKEYKEQCKKNINTILFFYSNAELYKDASERVGYILSNLKSKNPEKIMIYSFDYDLDISMIEILKNVYNVTSPNIVIMDEKIKIENIKNIQEIEKYLD